MRRQAKASVTPVRQRTQYSCVAASTMMCLQALGVKCDEDQVNDVLGAQPMRGASWENVLACAQHYGMRATLVCPSTIRQLKDWTDRGIPVIIAWNPEGREWSHASVVFDVDAALNVYVADPNIPDPEETVRVATKDEFYRKWYEKWPKYLVRRPACAIEREISSDGLQRFATSGIIPAVSSKGPERVLETPAGILVSGPVIHKMLRLFPRNEKIGVGWLVKTGLTQLDEIFFIHHGPVAGDTAKNPTIYYKVVEREPIFQSMILPMLDGVK